MEKGRLDYGPLKTILDTEDFSEVMVNAWNKVFVEHKGLIVQTSSRFIDQRQFQDLVYSILINDKKNIDSGFFFDGILPEGHRYNITLPPLSPNSATLTIRKFSAKIFSLGDLIDKSFLSEKAALFLKSAVESRLNIIISGGTGTGKTSFLNTLSTLIPDGERVVSIEDTQEIKTSHPNWIPLLVVKGDKKNVTARDCLVNSLRMRPDRIVMGECRGPEAFDMLQALNTGHEGSLTTLHSNSAVDCLARLESLVTLGHSEIPLRHIRHQMASAIDLIVQLRRHTSGERQIVEITELTGMNAETITRSNIFELNRAGELDVTGYVPQCLTKMIARGSKVKSNYFDPAVKVRRSS